MAKRQEKRGLEKDLPLEGVLTKLATTRALDFIVVRTPEGWNETVPNSGPTVGSLLFPGSFNPLHRGHLRMADEACQRYGRECWLEISMTNVDKPALDVSDIIARIQQRFPPFGLIITNAPRFTQKSKLFPGVTFVVGADTIRRFNDLKYHRSEPEIRSQAIKDLQENDCRFLVFGRKIANKFVDQENISLDEATRPLCVFVNRSEFSADVSSSQIRERKRS